MAYLKGALSGASDAEVALPFRDSPIVRDLGNGLAVTYVIDTRSIQNLTELARAKIKVQPYGNVYAVLLDGNFEASLLLVDALWDKGLSHLAPNGFIAALPARDVLAFCDANLIEGVKELRQLIARLENGDHLLSPELFRRSRARWIPWA
jgi:hypothetical protein